jgi:hypothetical protein
LRRIVLSVRGVSIRLSIRHRCQNDLERYTAVFSLTTSRIIDDRPIAPSYLSFSSKAISHTGKSPLSLKGDKDLHRNDPRLVCPVHDLARDNDCCQMQEKFVLQTQSVNTMSTADDIALLLDQEKMTPNPSRT